MISATGEYFGAASNKRTGTINAENTWLSPASIAGPSGAMFFVPVRVKVLSGSPVVTIQVKGSGEEDTEWLDCMSTDGVVNLGAQLKLVDIVPVCAGLDYRIGVKTGQIGAGSVKITFGQ